MPDICDRISPPTIQIGEDRVVSCLLYEDDRVADQNLQNNSTRDI
jgi:hypothetical protein